MRQHSPMRHQIESGKHRVGRKMPTSSPDCGRMDRGHDPEIRILRISQPHRSYLTCKLGKQISFIDSFWFTMKRIMRCAHEFLFLPCLKSEREILSLSLSLFSTLRLIWLYLFLSRPDCSQIEFIRRPVIVLSNFIKRKGHCTLRGKQKSIPYWFRPRKLPS